MEKKDLRTRFYSHVNVIEDKDSCWEWQGAHDRRGYGLLRLDKTKMVRAHRLVWEIETGTAVPNGLCSCHRCDNPKCVRLDHLFIGSNAINSWDRDRKGRTPKGETKWNHKLTVDSVKLIHKLYSEGVEMKQLAEAFALNAGTVWAAIFGKNWRSVPGWEEETVRDKKKKAKLIEEVKQ